MQNEITQINKSILREYGVSYTSYLFMLILMYYPGTKIDINLAQAILCGFILENDVGYYLTKEGLDFIKYVDGENKLILESKKASSGLVDELRLLFPEGKKSGTNKYWRDNANNVTKKLNQFYKTYGAFDDDKIIEATKKYIDSYGDNQQLMRVLPYFIMKNDESELLTILENVDSVDKNSNNDMWATVLK